MNEFEIRYFELENGKQPFIEWLNTLDKINKKRVIMRLSRIQEGNLGDYKKIDNELCEFRLKYGSGYRIYYLIENNTIIILLSGGDKSTQTKDIKKAKEFIEILKGQYNG